MVAAATIASLTTQLAQIVLRNSAAVIITRVKAIRTGKQHDEQVNRVG